MAVSVAQDIRRLFTEMDVAHVKVAGVLLDDFEYMRDPAHAQKVLDAVSTGAMPLRAAASRLGRRIPFSSSGIESRLDARPSRRWDAARWSVPPADDTSLAAQRLPLRPPQPSRSAPRAATPRTLTATRPPRQANPAERSGNDKRCWQVTPPPAPCRRKLGGHAWPRPGLPAGGAAGSGRSRKWPPRCPSDPN
jgi:hypothetical protein